MLKMCISTSITLETAITGHKEPLSHINRLEVLQTPSKHTFSSPHITSLRWNLPTFYGLILAEKIWNGFKLGKMC